jgi:hypothetical protein
MGLTGFWIGKFRLDLGEIPMQMSRHYYLIEFAQSEFGKLNIDISHIKYELF